MRMVIALGGNALGNTPGEQLKLVKETAKQIVKIIKKGHEVVIVHGNGPQVGTIFNAFANVDPTTTDDDMPFAECGAMSQGYIGYHLQQAISDELARKHISKKCVTIVTQVLVDKKDKAFKNPTKPVGPFYTKEQANKIAKKTGYVFIEDAGRGYRRVVPSPKPVNILEEKVVDTLLKNGSVVITCGGGGIPVVEHIDGYKGVDAVIDKDFAACKLASLIKADVLMILTAVSRVCIGFNTENQKELSQLTVSEAKKYIMNGEFAKGSMLPKVEACVKFVEENPKKYALIADLSEVLAALKGQTGTKIIK